MTRFASDLILARLQKLHPKAIDLSLERLWRLLALLDHPERKVAPVVHVAGTNGKGSTLAVLDALLQAAGWRVQRYISPHLVQFNERILFAGRPIDEADLAAVLDRCEQANDGAPITFFEITTAAAFLAFAERPADILLLETGLGGRLDATNVIARPRLTALTPIALDHQGFLGDSLAAIAGEKAGILKPGVVCVSGPQPEAALAVIPARAAALGVPLWRHGVEWQAEAAGDRLQVRVRDTTFCLPLPPLRGPHQIDNAGLAIACAQALPEFAPTSASMAAGLAAVTWPARLQRLRHGPLASRLPPGAELWLDGGHNPAAGAALAASFPEDGRPLDLIVGMLDSKDAAGFLRPLAARARLVRTVPVPGEPASLDAASLAATACEQGLAAAPAADLPTALRELRAAGGPPARILICGSLYLAGHVLRDSS